MGNSSSRRQEQARQRRLEDTGLTPQQLNYLRNSVFGHGSVDMTTAIATGQAMTPSHVRSLVSSGGVVDAAYLPYGAAPVARAPPPELQRTRTINNDVNLRKGTLSLVYDEKSKHYRVGFSIDANKPCAVTILFCASEDVNSENMTLSVSSPFPAAREVIPAGLKKEYILPPELSVDLNAFRAEHLNWTPGGSVPLLIVLEPTNESEIGSIQRIPARTRAVVAPTASIDPNTVQCQRTYVSLEKNSSAPGGFSLKAERQKIQVNGRAYELKEIYGMEGSTRRTTESESGKDDDDDDDITEETECVICRASRKDTMVLPCRHLCLCAACAQELRFQTDKCPLCRGAITSFLQIHVESKGSQSRSSGNPTDEAKINLQRWGWPLQHV